MVFRMKEDEMKENDRHRYALQDEGRMANILSWDDAVMHP